MSDDERRVITEVIRLRIVSLARRNRLSWDDRLEFEQELFCRFVPAMARYDPGLGSLECFARVAILRLSLNLIRERRKRRFELLTPVVWDRFDHGRTNPVTCESRLFTDEINALIAGLPDELRDAAEALKTKSLSEYARERGMTRHAVRGLLRRIARKWKKLLGES